MSKTKSVILAHGNEMRNAWMTGTVAALSVVLFAWLFQQLDALTLGLSLFGWKITESKYETTVAALLLVAATVFIADALRLFVFEKSKSIQIHTEIHNRRFSAFGWHCLVKYIETIITLWLVIFFYKTAGEYGYERQAAFYQVWFDFLDMAWCLVVVAALPYIAVSTAFTDSKNPASFGLFKLLVLLSKIVLRRQDEYDRAQHSAALAQLRGLILRLLFLPLATVLFTQHFAVLVQSMHHLGDRVTGNSALGDYTHAEFNRALVKTGMALILSMMAATAACGYLLTSRWLDNHFKSTDATLKGWTVCLLSFPPFTLAVTWFFKGPMEHGFLSLGSQTLISVLAFLFVGLFAISLFASLCFGARYSNLTNRGIIRVGPYAWVRHPDYAAMNLAWWCTGIPFLFFVMDKQGFTAGATLFIGLCLNTVIYYLRAITEERHLMNDPAYVDYCKKVKYRFIPGIF